MNRRDLFLSTAKAALATALGGSWRRRGSAQTSQPPGGSHRDADGPHFLPIPEPKPATIDVLDARNAIPPGRFEVKAPANAPNVLIVLIDDMGFGQSSASAVQSTCLPWSDWPTKGFDTISSTLRRCVHPRALHC